MPFADFLDFDDCESKNKDKGDPGAYCGKIKHQVEGEVVVMPELDPRGDGPVIDVLGDDGQGKNIIENMNSEPILFKMGENSSHDYPGKIVINNESRYVDREVKRSYIPNVAESGATQPLNDITQPTLPTGAPDHNMHGLNFNDEINWNEVVVKPPCCTEAVSIPASLVERDVSITDDSEDAKRTTNEEQLELESEYTYKEMKEALIRNDMKQIMSEAVAQFVEEQHPRAEDGKFTSGGGGVHKPHLPTTGFDPEPIQTSTKPEQAHMDTAKMINKVYPNMDMKFLEQQAMKADQVRQNATTQILTAANKIQDKFPQADIQYRVKTRRNMLEKMGRKTKYKDVSELKDVSGLRTIVSSNEEVFKVVSELKKDYKIIEEENYIDTPKEGYRSYHVVVENKDGTNSEIQIRTPNQDKWATWAHDSVYKPGTPELKKQVQENIQIVTKYAEDLSDYYLKLDRGEKIAKPDCPPEISNIEVCLET